MGQRPLAVLTEGAVLKSWLIQIHIQKPANEAVGVQSLRKQPTAPYRTPRDQHLTLQQLSNRSDGIEGQPTVLYISAEVGDSPCST